MKIGKNLARHLENLSARAECCFTTHLPAELRIPYFRARSTSNKDFSKPRISMLVKRGTMEEFTDWMLAQVATDIELVSFERDMLTKVGPQGGQVPLALLKEKVLQYYERPRRNVSPPPAMIRSRDRLIARIKDAGMVLHYMQPERLKTFSGLPNLLKKDDPIDIEFREDAHHTMNPVLYPAIAGHRYQRNAVRAIFMDSSWNVATIERDLTAIRNYLRTHFIEFGSWLNPQTIINPLITGGMTRGYLHLEGDHKAKDQNVTLKLMEELVFPVWEIFPGGKRLIDIVSRLMHIPVIVGDEIIFGPHNQFSGMAFVTDAQTILGYIYQDALVEELNIFDFYHLSLGDDMLIGGKFTPNIGHTMLNLFLEWSSLCGEVAHPEKQRTNIAFPRYLKRLYKPQFPKIEGNVQGAYPAILAVNSIIHPEKAEDNHTTSWYATLSRLDNLVGHPQYNNIVTWLLARLYHRIGGLCKGNKDWWERVYGERWSHRTSRSFRILAQIYPEFAQEIGLEFALYEASNSEN